MSNRLTTSPVRSLSKPFAFGRFRKNPGYFRSIPYLAYLETDNNRDEMITGLGPDEKMTDLRGELATANGCTRQDGERTRLHDR